MPSVVTWHSGQMVLFSCPEQLNRWPCHWLTHSLTHSLRVLLLLTLQSDPRDLRRLRHLIRVMKRHDLTEKRPTYNIPTQYPPTYICTSIREHPKGAILETCDLWDIWSEWWEDMTWPKNTYIYQLFFNFFCPIFFQLFSNYFQICFQLFFQLFLNFFQHLFNFFKTF